MEVLTLSGDSGAPDIEPGTQRGLIEQARDMARRMARILAAGNSCPRDVQTAVFLAAEILLSYN